MGEPIKITLPIPAWCLSPNAPNSRNFHARSKARREQREAAFGYASVQVRSPGPKWLRVRLTVRWFAKSSAYIPDFDNAIASIKGAVDGITDAGVILNDRGVEGVDLWRVVDKASPRVEITVTQTEERATP